jgi:hypothetical protein
MFYKKKERNIRVTDGNETKTILKAKIKIITYNRGVQSLPILNTLGFEPSKI